MATKTRDERLEVLLDRLENPHLNTEDIRRIEKKIEILQSLEE